MIEALGWSTKNYRQGPLVLMKVINFESSNGSPSYWKEILRFDMLINVDETSFSWYTK